MNQQSLKNLLLLNHIIQMIVFVVWNPLMIVLAVMGVSMLSHWNEAAHGKFIGGAILVFSSIVGFLGNRYLDERTPATPAASKN